MLGNYMPANRDGCIVTAFFITFALGIVFAGHLLGSLIDSPWPTYVAWAMFVLLTINFVLFAKRHS